MPRHRRPHRRHPPMPPAITQPPTHMLFIPVWLNNYYPAIAQLDTGASRSLISRSCVEHCGLREQIDKRYRQEFIGIGGIRKKALGMIHSCKVEVVRLKSAHGLWPVHVMTDSVATIDDILIALDLLTHWQAVVDLPRQVLRFSFCAKEVPFLSQMDIAMLRRIGFI